MKFLYRVQTILEHDKWRGLLTAGCFLISLGLLLPWIVRYDPVLNRTDFDTGTSLLYVYPFGVFMCLTSVIIGGLAIFSNLTTKEIGAWALLFSGILLTTLVVSWLTIGPHEEDFAHFWGQLEGQRPQWDWGIGIYLTASGTLLAFVSGLFSVLPRPKKQQVTSSLR